MIIRLLPKATILLAVLLQLSLPHPCRSIPFLTSSAGDANTPKANPMARNAKSTPMTMSMPDSPPNAIITATHQSKGTNNPMDPSHPNNPNCILRGGATQLDDHQEEEQEFVPSGPELYPGEIMEIRKEQSFLEKQRLRRELDKTWLDKGITAFVEFFENVFRWEVID